MYIICKLPFIVAHITFVIMPQIVCIYKFVIFAHFRPAIINIIFKMLSFEAVSEWERAHL